MHRLHIQPGLSSRVVRALQDRIQVALGMAASSAAGHRTPSRSRGRDGVDTVEEPANPAPPELDATPGIGGSLPGADTVHIPMDSNPGPLEGAPGVPTGRGGDGAVPTSVAVTTGDADILQILTASSQLADSLGACSNRMMSLGNDLSASIDIYSAGQKELKIALDGIAEQISKQASAITALSGGLAHKQSEVTKLLKAFDRFSSLGKWALSGNNPVVLKVAVSNFGACPILYVFSWKNCAFSR